MKYIFKRLLLFIPVLLVISVLVFFLNANQSSDPVLTSYQNPETGEFVEDNADIFKTYKYQRKVFGFDKPVFYFSIGQRQGCDTLNRIPFSYQREFVKQWTRKYGNWSEILPIFRAIQNLKTHETYTHDKRSYLKLWETKNTAHLLSEIRNHFNTSQIPAMTFERLCFRVNITARKFNRFIPQLNFNGAENQFHFWLFGKTDISRGIIRGDFGTSFLTKQPVRKVLKDAILITLSFTLFGILISLLISIPLGLHLGLRAGSRFDKTISNILFGLYSLPVYWIGVLLILLLGRGGILDLLPTHGLANWVTEYSFFENLSLHASYLIMPIICLVYPTLAFLTRHVRASVIETTDSEYIKTARAKGLKRSRINRVHILRNSLFPLITILASLISFALGGSVVIELIFGIPGMGKLMVEGIMNSDYPLITGAVLVSTLAIMIGFLLSDILYKTFDPRVKL